MAFLDEDDDDLLAGTVLQDTKSLQSAHKSALKWLQDRDSKRQRKEHSAQAQRDKLQQLQAELAINEEQNALEEQQRKMEEMSTKVIEELDKGDTEAGGPEPEAHLQTIHPVQALPDLQLQSLPELQAALQQQRSLLNLPPQDPISSTPSSSDSDPQALSEAFAWLLAEGGPLERCPGEAAARATFGALCYGSSSLALAAYNRFVAWCGEPEVVAGCEMLDLSQLLQWSAGVSNRTPAAADLAPGTALADGLPLTTIPWLPSAADVLQALADMGCSRQQQQQGGASQQQQQQGSQKQQQQRRGSKQRSTSQQQQQHQQQEGSQPQQSQQQQQQQQQQQGEDGDGFAFRHGNLPLLLRLVVRVCRGHSAGRLDAGGLVGNAQQYLQLLLALLGLMLDQWAALTCRYCLPEAFAALLELPPESAWDRLVRDTAPGSLLAALSGSLGPSHSSSSSSSGGGGLGSGPSAPSGPCHRSAVVLLCQMPRSDRGRVLRQLGALQLMGKLIPGAKQQVPPARVSSMDPSRLRQTLHQEVRTLLGPESKLRVLLTGLSQPPEPGGSLQVWLLSSVLEAADMVLWEDVSTPGVGISLELRAWLLDWLKALDRVLDKRLSTHLVRSRVAAMENAYDFATSGCVV